MRRSDAWVHVLSRLSAYTLLYGAFACSSAYEGESMTFTGPTQQDFGKVAETLDYACGNLACHGSPLRNLRLYGDQGRRLDPKDVPCGKPTTAAEQEADYRSLVALEPELTSAVVDGGGVDPERLTLVRKARGVEKHTGGSVFRDSTDAAACVDGCKDDPVCSAACYGDRCLVSWLGGDVDVPACGNALPETRCNPQ
jgi:hypothetical protein